VSIRPSWSEFLWTAKLALIYAIGTLATIALGVVIAVVIVGAGHITLVPAS
jgi:hypothetical protein